MSATAFNRKRRELAKLENQIQNNTALNESELSELTLNDLKDLAKEKSVSGYSTMNKKQLIEALNK